MGRMRTKSTTLHLNPAEYRPCFSCGMLVRVQAIRCRFCGTDLPPGEPLPTIVERASKKIVAAETRKADGTYPHKLLRFYGSKFRFRTLFTTGWLFAAIGAIVLLDWLQAQGTISTSEAGGWTALLAFSLLLDVTAMIVFVWQDLWTPSWRRCQEPGGAIEAFFTSLLYSRWSYAHALLQEGERTVRARFRPEIADLYLDSCGASFLSSGGVRAYWKPFLNNTSGISRYVTFEGFEVEQIDEQNALARVRYRAKVAKQAGDTWFTLFFVLVFTSCLAWFMIIVAVVVLIGGLLYSYTSTRRVVEVDLVKWMHRVDDQWYLVNGEYASGEDMLPKLYFDCMDRLRAGEMPPAEVLVKAAGMSEGLLEHGALTVDETGDGNE